MAEVAKVQVVTTNGVVSVDASPTVPAGTKDTVVVTVPVAGDGTNNTQTVTLNKKLPEFQIDLAQPLFGDEVNAIQKLYTDIATSGTNNVGITEMAIATAKQPSELIKAFKGEHRPFFDFWLKALYQFEHTEDIEDCIKWVHGKNATIPASFAEYQAKYPLPVELTDEERALYDALGENKFKDFLTNVSMAANELKKYGLDKKSVDELRKRYDELKKKGDVTDAKSQTFAEHTAIAKYLKLMSEKEEILNPPKAAPARTAEKAPDPKANAGKGVPTARTPEHAPAVQVQDKEVAQGKPKPLSQPEARKLMEAFNKGDKKVVAQIKKDRNLYEQIVKMESLPMAELIKFEDNYLKITDPKAYKAKKAAEAAQAAKEKAAAEKAAKEKAAAEKAAKEKAAAAERKLQADKKTEYALRTALKDCKPYVDLATATYDDLKLVYEDMINTYGEELVENNPLAQKVHELIEHLEQNDNTSLLSDNELKALGKKLAKEPAKPAPKKAEPAKDVEIGEVGTWEAIKDATASGAVTALTPVVKGAGYLGDGVKFVADHTGLTDMAKSAARKDGRTELVIKNLGGTFEGDGVAAAIGNGTVMTLGGAGVVAGEVAAQPLDIASYLTEVPSEYGLDWIEGKVNDTSVAEVKTDGDRAKRAGSDLLKGLTSPVKALNGALKVTGGTMDEISSGLKMEDTVNGVIKDTTKVTMENIAALLDDKSIDTTNEIKGAVREAARMGILPENFQMLEKDQVRRLIRAEYSKDMPMEIKGTYKKKGKKYQRTIKIDPMKADSLRQIVTTALAQAAAKRAADLEVHQRQQGIAKLDDGQASIRNAVSEAANAPAAVVDLAASGIHAGAESLVGKKTADFLAAPFDLVAGTVQMATTSFDAKDGSTKEAGSKALNGVKKLVSFGFWGSDEEKEPVKVEDRALYDAPTREEAKAESEKAYLAAYDTIVLNNAVKNEINSQFIAVRKVAAAIVEKENPTLQTKNPTDKQMEEFAKLVDKKTAEIYKAGKYKTADGKEVVLKKEADIRKAAEKKQKLLKAATAKYLKAHASELNPDDVKRLVQRLENQGLRYPEFWNFMDAKHSNKDNTAGDREWYHHLGRIFEGAVMALPRDITTKPVTTTDKALALLCVEVATPTTLIIDGAVETYQGAKEIVDNPYNSANQIEGDEKLGKGFIKLAAGVAQGIVGTTGKNEGCGNHKHHFKKHHHHKKSTTTRITPKPTPKPQQPDWDYLFTHDIDEYLKQCEIWGRTP